MRRWFAILLLLSMPFQFGWSVAAAYCAHESGPGARHVGHHEHEHQASQGESADASAAQPGTGLFDVADCHGHCACAVALPAALRMPVMAGGTRPAACAWRAALPPAPARPERPQWLRTA